MWLRLGQLPSDLEVGVPDSPVRFLMIEYDINKPAVATTCESISDAGRCCTTADRMRCSLVHWYAARRVSWGGRLLKPAVEQIPVGYFSFL